MIRHVRSRRLTVAVAVLAAGAGSPAPASAAFTASAASPHRGWIGLRVTGGVPGGRVVLREGGAALGHARLDRRGAATLGRVARWTCPPRIRLLTVAPAEGAPVDVAVQTPSCDRRLDLRTTPRRPRAGARFTLRITDRWRLGRQALCVRLASPAGAEACRAARLTPRGAVLRLRAPRPGRWSLQVSGGTALARTAALRIRPRRGRLAVLATGDSMMSPVARTLPAALPSARVRRDVHYGAGISTSFVLDWREHARVTTAQWRPDVVALFIGGHEGVPFGDVGCCEAPWAGAYAARARAVLASYLRGGAAQVYVLLLPAPGDAARVPVVQAVNAGLAEAVAGLGPRARVLDLPAIFTPGFVYRRDMLIDGLLTPVRDPDGLHLTRAGGRLAAGAIAAALVQDGVITPSGAAAGRGRPAGRARAAGA